MQSPTYGKLSISDITKIIADKASSNPESFKVFIGTDSQNFDRTKVVLVIAVTEIGHGGFFFYDVSSVRRMDNVREKILYETQLSLSCADELMEEFEKQFDSTGFDYTLLDFCIHVDAGNNGKSKQVIPDIVAWITACGYKCETKPYSFAASSIANKYSK